MNEFTKYEDVIDSFHSTFQDRVEIPESLEQLWFKKAVGKFSFEVDSINYDDELEEFDKKLHRYVVDTLGLMMKVFYQERELSKVNKRISIVSKDLSIDGSNASKTAAKSELDSAKEELKEMLYKLTPSAYN